MSYRTSLKSCALATTSVAVIGAALAAAAVVPAFAQDDASAQDRVVVTGSRIQRRDFQANSPLVTVDSSAFESQTGLNVEAYLNQLPQFNPAASPVTTEGDVQVTAINSVGIATSSLRGLGANRTLTLVNGRRRVPVNTQMITDLNGIPSALIARTEIITGGASAVYGPDAVGGVMNFIMRDNYEGLEVDTQYGLTEAGDGEEFRISSVMGANLANGRGNVTFAAEHYSRSATLERNRDWQRAEWGNPLLGTGDFFNVGHGYVSAPYSASAGVGGLPNLAAISAVFADRPAGTQVCSSVGFGANCANGTTFAFNADGTIYQNNGGGTGLGGLSSYNGPIDGEEWALQTIYNTGAFGPANPVVTESLKWNNTEAYMGAPQTRYSFFGSGNYDLTDAVELFIQGSFAESNTRTRLFPSPAIGGWEATIPYNPATDSPLLPSLDYTNEAVIRAALANPNSPAYRNPGFIPTGTMGAQHPVTPELAALLNSRPGAQRSANWQLNFIPQGWFDDRSTVNNISVWQIEAGLRGELPFRDFTWEAYMSHGEANTYNVAYGNFSLERYRAIMTAADYGRNAAIPPNQGSIRPGFGAADGVCTSGFYNTIFGGDVPPSEDCIFSIEAPLQTRTQMQQTIVEATAQGGLFELPAGEIRSAAGIQYREVEGQFVPDNLQSMRSFLDQVIGVYPAAPMDASTVATEAFGELLVPVISDIPFIQNFEVELGARYAMNDSSPNSWTYKALANWEVNDWLRLRGGYNRASRAPNLGELFLGKQMIFTAQAAYGDPCGIRSQAPWGAGGAQDVTGEGYAVNGSGQILDPSTTNVTPIQLAPGQTQAGANSTYLICRAQMEAAVNGTGATPDVFYGQPQPGGGSSVGFLWIYQQGTPNLEAEKADTWTAGLVANSPFDGPWLGGFTASVDWYSIEINDAIQLATVNVARSNCYSDVTVSTLDEARVRAASVECAGLQRIGGTTPGFAGTADDIILPFANQATIKTSGVDVALNWSGQFDEIGIGLPGGLGVNIQGTILDSYRTKESFLPTDLEYEWRGTTGPNLPGTNSGAYDYRVNTSLSYFLDGKNFTLRWRHLPSVWGTNQAIQEAQIENNMAVAAGGPGNLITFTPHTSLKTESYDVFDMSFNWDINDMLTLRGSINNLFDRDPPKSGRSEGRPLGEWTPADFAAVCDAYGGGGAAPGLPGPMGCANPQATGWTLPNPGTASAGFYDVQGRSYSIGLKARF